MSSPARILRPYLSGATSVQRPNLVPDVPLWISDPNVAGGKESTKPPSASPPARSRETSDATPCNGFGATEVDLTLRRQFKLHERAFAAGPRRFLQHLQPPQLRPAGQLYDLAAVRPGDPDARILARRWRPDRRPQSAVPDRRPALCATGAEADVLSLRPAAQHRTCSRAECVRVSVGGANRLQRAESHEIRSRCSFDFSPGLTFRVLIIESQPPTLRHALRMAQMRTALSSMKVSRDSDRDLYALAFGQDLRPSAGRSASPQADCSAFALLPAIAPIIVPSAA